MRSYNALLEKSDDPRFDRFPIVLKMGTPVHKNTKLSWIEEIDENATNTEKDWYDKVVKINLKG